MEFHGVPPTCGVSRATTRATTAVQVRYSDILYRVAPPLSPRPLALNKNRLLLLGNGFTVLVSPDTYLFCNAAPTILVSVLLPRSLLNYYSNSSSSTGLCANFSNNSMSEQSVLQVANESEKKNAPIDLAIHGYGRLMMQLVTGQ